MGSSLSIKICCEVCWMHEIFGKRSCCASTVCQICVSSDVNLRSFFGSVASRHYFMTEIPAWAIIGFPEELFRHVWICWLRCVSWDRRFAFLAYFGLLVSSAKQQSISSCTPSTTSTLRPDFLTSSILAKHSPSFWNTRSFTSFLWKTGSALIAKIVFVAPRRMSNNSGSEANFS